MRAPGGARLGGRQDGQTAAAGVTGEQVFCIVRRRCARRRRSGPRRQPPALGPDEGRATVLTTAEVLATARAVAPDATIRNLTTQEQVELDQALVKVPRTDADRRRHGPAVVTPFTTVDRPKVLVELDKKA